MLGVFGTRFASVLSGCSVDEGFLELGIIPACRWWFVRARFLLLVFIQVWGGDVSVIWTTRISASSYKWLVCIVDYGKNKCVTLKIALGTSKLYKLLSGNLYSWLFSMLYCKRKQNSMGLVASCTYFQ